MPLQDFETFQLVMAFFFILMDELIDITDENGKLLGRSELKSIIHQKGLYHHTAHVWLYTKNGEVLLSQRSAKKAICPLMWDVSVAGHVDAGETIKQAGVREIFEEIGLSITEDKLLKIGVFECFQSYENGMTDNEFHNTFLAELTVPISSLKAQEEEVEALKLISLTEFDELIADINTNNLHFVPSNKTYYEFVSEKIKEALQP
ncbi:NUDIX domain-containing protein [Tamlana sp. 2_MG-2023]|uniref:NUDIX hydrolase n=1 Tax=unclassified Tamlana TaxID=2614803 RepID=UPI0026E2873C|nr:MULTISPECIES: NUDIX domain-containing protein [unclassified Tamlana]MDO6759258.1 NUDIX domain-containing protein [Tamlana sp. 2_MG-2023]MDO6790603.1 NUDIX domain-containing protein [Tamlana sp. 1_MG-2023]